MAQIMLLTGCMVGYAYSMEFFVAWYSGNPYESFAFVNRALGPYWWGYWAMIFCNVVVPQFFWFEKYRRHIPFLFITSILVNIGMWFERFVIVGVCIIDGRKPHSILFELLSDQGSGTLIRK